MIHNFIIIRRTLPWNTIVWSEFLQQTFLHTEVSTYKFIIPLLQHWDKYCGLSYFQYRAGLKAIAEQSWRAIPKTRIKQVRWHNSFLKRSRDTIATYVDDDDWVAPNLFTSVRSANHRASRIFFWNAAVAYYAKPIYCIRDNKTQYAMLGPVDFKGVYSINLLSKAKTHTSGHGKRIIGHMDQKHITIIHENLSVTVQSLGSISRLKHLIAASGPHKTINSIQADDPKQSIHNFEKAITDRVEIDTDQISSDLKWSAVYAEQVNELNKLTFGSTQVDR